MNDLQSLHRCFIGFSKRAERVSDEQLVATFVDAEPLFHLLSTTDNQVIYGRRGTGKTHALKCLSEHVRNADEFAVYVDLRTVGSSGSIYSDGTRRLSERATTLLLDVLREIHDSILEIAVENLDRINDPSQLSNALDDFGDAITSVKIVGEAEQEQTSQRERIDETSAGARLGVGSAGAVVNLGYDEQAASTSKDSVTTRLRGQQEHYLQFGSIQDRLSRVLGLMNLSRLWLLIDEWSEIPLDLQPYLADLLRRAVLPIGPITVKIGAIEHRSAFTIHSAPGEYIGMEIGADAGADLNLDDFMVFDNDEEKATDFFKKLLFKHYLASSDPDSEIQTPDGLIHATFTQVNVFQEFVRAVEGIPRDAMYLASTVAQKAYGQRITMQHVRSAARDWYQRDKAKLVRDNPELDQLLHKVIEEVIAHRRARAFLFPSGTRDTRLDSLFDGRLMHILKRSISSRDEPGKRYDVYKLDYGCYVDLIATSQAPRGLFAIDGGEEQSEYLEVPPDDYRSIRRAILSPSDLLKAASTTESPSSPTTS